MAYVHSAEFGAEATNGGIMPVVLGGRQRPTVVVPLFRVQFAPDCLGLRRTTHAGTTPGGSWSRSRQRGVRQRARRRVVPTVAVRSERDGRQQFQLATGGGSQRDADMVRSNRAALPRCLARTLWRRAASVAGLSRTHRSSMSTGSNGIPVKWNSVSGDLEHGFRRSGTLVGA